MAGILKGVADRELHGCLPGKSRDLGEVRFTEADIRVFLEKFKGERKWVDGKEIAQRLRVKESTVSRWVEAGLLSPMVVCGSMRYFDHGAVEEFITGHVFIEEAAEILSAGVDVVQQWTREGQLKPYRGRW